MDSLPRMETIFSSSGPDVLPVIAVRNGINRFFALKPVFSRTEVIRAL
jgi:hypothetical protein